MKYGCYTLIIESRMSHVRDHMFDFGWGRGYVLLPIGHPFYGADYDNIDVNIHGGLTYSGVFVFDNFLRWIEKSEIGCDINVDNFKNFDNYWIIGFDTSHYNDTLFNCSKRYDLNETNRLLDQCVSDSLNGIKKYKIGLRCKKLKSIIDKME